MLESKVFRTMGSRRLPLWIHCVLLVSICVLEAKLLTGIPLHEWLAAAAAVLLLVHLLFQWPWIVSQGRRLLRPDAIRTRVNYALNIVLLVAMVAAMLSGFMESQVLFPQRAPVVVLHRWHELHGATSRFMLLILGLHIALNWDWMLRFFRGAIESAGTGGLSVSWFSLRTLGRVGVLVTATTVLAGGILLISHAVPFVRQLSPREMAIMRQRELRLPYERWPSASGLRAFAVHALALVLAALAGRKLLRLRL